MAERKTILIADDEDDLLEIISYFFLKEGHNVFVANDGNEALEKALAIVPDMVILDVMMPYKTGIEVCKILRADSRFNNTFIILLTALTDEERHIGGLNAGADDYIKKPISLPVLYSRANALFRRTSGTNQAKDQILSFGELIINLPKHLITVNGKVITLARKEFALLKLLALKPGRVYLREEILEKIWGNEVMVGDRTIDVHVAKIKRKLGVNCIATIKGVGYKFESNQPQQI